MVELFKRHGVGLVWSFVVFTLAFLFYLSTMAFTPYPGLSSEFLTALHYPAHAPQFLNSPSDVVLLRSLVQWVSPNLLLPLLHGLQGVIGALLLTCLFRTTIATVRHACADMSGIRNHELDHTLFTISHVSFSTALGAATLGLTLLPLWASATRPFPETIAALLAALTLTLALEFRWRSMQNLILDLEPKLRHGIILFATYALLFYLAVTHTSLLPVSLLAFILSSGVFIKHEARGRLTYVAFAGAGIIVGLITSVCITAIWANILNTTQAPLPNAISLWGTHLSSNLQTFIGSFRTPEGLIPLIFFLTAAALFMGCFPFAYLKLGAPLIGQLACICLGGALLFQWPADVWCHFEEPSALGLIGSWMAMLCLGAVIGSWMHHFLERKPMWNRYQTRFCALSVTFLLTGAFAITQGVFNYTVASSRPMQQAMQPILPTLDSLIPEEARLWVTRDTDTLGIIARRTLSGKPLHPQAEDFSSLNSAALLNHVTLRDVAQNDPLMKRMASLGGEPLRQYLLAERNTLGILTTLDAQRVSVEAANVANHLETTDFGQTSIGQRCITLLRRWAAREHAACAIAAAPEVAATHLRLARTLDPDNEGVPLSLNALSAHGITLTQAERDAARDILEADSRWRAPTEHEALAFEYRYGPVHTPGFCSASRLRRFRLGNARAVLEELLHLYKTAPEQLSQTERLVAIMYMPEAELFDYVSKSNPEDDDMILFFCLYPQHPQATELYQQHYATLKTRDALTVLFRNQKSHLRDRTTDKMLAFFLRDNTFGYALYYLNALLKEDKLDEAATFVNSFNVRERLAKTPVLHELLYCRVLEKLEPVAPAQARTLCQTWLRSNPKQSQLWTHLLSAQDLSSEALRPDIEACLIHYPLHPVATQRYAELLEQEFGLDIAKRYRTAIQKAINAGNCIQKDTHAHRRF